jgi:hypothetical protein
VFENRREPILPTPIFIRRLLGCVGLALVIIAVALSIGVAGYHFIAGLPWIDALLNAFMILTDMGPVDVLHDVVRALAGVLLGDQSATKGIYHHNF